MFKKEDLLIAKQKALLVSKIHIYDDKFIDYELNEKCFTGPYKLLARAINKVQEKYGFIDETYLVDFLIEHNSFNSQIEKVFLELLITTGLPFTIAMQYEKDLIENLIRKDI